MTEHTNLRETRQEITPGVLRGRQREPEAIPSKAAIAGHPIHPMLIAFPVCFLAFALPADVVFWSTGDPFWARASLWLLGAGVVSGAVAGIAGSIDFFGIERVRRYRAAWVHFLGNVIALGIALINFLYRLGDAQDAVLPAGLVLSLLTAALISVTGWYGGELSYRHRIGVSPRYH